MSQRTVWIVDAAYLMKASPGRFDYLRLKNVLEECCGTRFDESFYLNSTSNPPSDDQDAFHTWLKSAPPKGPKMRVMLYSLKDLYVECPTCGHSVVRKVQKGVDVGVATLIVKLASQDRYDRVVLAAGDGDFEDAIAYAKETLHKEVWLCGYEGSVSADLQSYADEVIWLDPLWERFSK